MPDTKNQMTSVDVTVTLVGDPDEKAAIATDVLADLPEWFGIPESTQEYIQQSKNLPVMVAYASVTTRDIDDVAAETVAEGERDPGADADDADEGDPGVPVGFIAVQQNTPNTAEIVCLAVKRDYHRLGIGRDLVEAVIADCRDKYDLLQVKTVAEGHYPQYDATVGFYRAMGFYDLEVIPELWDAHNPCLIMVLPLALVD